MDVESVTELRRIGNNLNQVAKLMNQAGMVLELERWEEVRGKLHELILKLLEKRKLQKKG